MEKIDNKKESMDGKSDLITVSSKLFSVLNEKEDKLKRQKELLSQLGEKIDYPLTIDEDEMLLYEEFYELSKQKSDLISPKNLLRLKELFSQLGDKIDTPKEMNEEEMIVYIEFYELGKDILNLTNPNELFKFKKFSLLADEFYLELRRHGSKEFEAGCLLVSKLNEKIYLYNKTTKIKIEIKSREVFHNTHLCCFRNEFPKKDLHIINIQSGEEKLSLSNCFNHKIIKIGSKVEGLEYLDVKDVTGVERRIPCSNTGIIDLGIDKELLLVNLQYEDYQVFDPDSESVIIKGSNTCNIERKIEEALINIKFDSLKKHGDYYPALKKGFITITYNG